MDTQKGSAHIDGRRAHLHIRRTISGKNTIQLTAPSITNTHKYCMALGKIINDFNQNAIPSSEEARLASVRETEREREEKMSL